MRVRARAPAAQLAYNVIHPLIRCEAIIKNHCRCCKGMTTMRMPSAASIRESATSNKDRPAAMDRDRGVLAL